MAIYKDVEPLEVFAWKSENEDFDKGVKFALEKLDTLPTADVQEVKHGEWKQVSGKYPRYVCTSCNHLYNNKEYKYCPFCGAKMDGGNNGQN